MGIGSHSSRATAENDEVTDNNELMLRTRSIVAVFVDVALVDAETEIVKTADAVFVDAAVTCADCSRTRSHAEVSDAETDEVASASRTFVAEHVADAVAVACA